MNCIADVQHRLIQHAAESLQQHLPDDLLARFGERIYEYGSALEPPLAKEDAAWARELLKTSGISR